MTIPDSDPAALPLPDPLETPHQEGVHRDRSGDSFRQQWHESSQGPTAQFAVVYSKLRDFRPVRKSLLWTFLWFVVVFDF